MKLDLLGPNKLSAELVIPDFSYKKIFFAQQDETYKLSNYVQM